MTTLNGFNAEPRLVTPQGFRIRRANATVIGFQPTPDRFVVDRLAELEKLLQKRIVPATDIKLLTAWIKLPLTPSRSGTTHKVGVGHWANDTLADKFRDQKEGATDRTMRAVIDADQTIAQLRYEFDESIDDRYSELDFNTRTVLKYPGIRDLLVLRAYLLYGIAQQPSLLNFVFTHAQGVKEVIQYGVISAARDYVQDRQLRVKGIDEDDSDAVQAVAAAGLSMSADSLADTALDVVTDFIEGSKYDELIEIGTKLKVTDIPADIRPRLVQYIKDSTVEVTTENAPFIVPMYLAKAATSTTTTSGAPTDDPFAVDFFVDDVGTLQVSTAAVKCASQLYYVMVLGEELGVFDAVRYFTHRYLFREGFAVEDPQLRRDLENYVFSEQFPGFDEETGEMRMMRCTRDAERRSFYRQVFDAGQEPVPGDGIPNTDFGRLWKILMLESARYLERAQVSPHPDNYVSRQNVMQAVEDTQYNLSSTCVGMATVMTPLMYAELDFVVKRILGHPEVRKHLVPSGGSWWQVVEKLQVGQGRRARASVLHNKARLGYALLRAIAEYTPSRFEENDVFAEFISNVDAFITTQSILQEESGEDYGDESETEPGEGSAYDGSGGSGGGYGSGSLPGMPDLSKMPGMPSIPGVSAPWPGMNGSGNGANGGSNGGSGSAVPSGAGSTGEWDF